MSRIRLSLLLFALFVSGLGESISIYWENSFNPTASAKAYQKPTPQRRSPSAGVNQEIDVNAWRAAAMVCNLDQVKALLAKGANVNAQASGMTALKMARAYGYNDIVALLKKAGAKE